MILCFWGKHNAVKKNLLVLKKSEILVKSLRSIYKLYTMNEHGEHILSGNATVVINSGRKKNHNKRKWKVILFSAPLPSKKIH